jgi:hypothetical protein
MKFEPGVIAIAIAILLFYARMAQIRGRKRKEQKQELIARMHSKRKGRVNPPNGVPRPNYEVGNWYVMGIGAILMLIGMAAKTANILPVMYQPYWWVVVTAGVLVFTLSIK